MFKAPKKKTKVENRSIRKGSDVDENEEDVSSSLHVALQETKQKRKDKSKQKDKKSGTTLSFSLDEGDDHLNKYRNKKKLRGMGFGGIVQEDVDIKENDENDLTKSRYDLDETGSSSLYSKSQLEKLKSEQKKYDLPVDKVANKDDNADKVPLKDLPSFIELPPQPSKHKPMSPAEEDFISFDTHILSGDEALRHMKEHLENDDEIGPNAPFDNRIQSLPTDSTTAKEALKGYIEQIDEEKESKSWEDEVARRAGISFYSDSVSSNIPTKKETEQQLLSKVKGTINSAIENFRLQENDLATKISRQRLEAESATKEAEKNEDELRSIGSMFEYYQQLRSNLVDWIGALRHLVEKLNVIEEAIKDLLVEISVKRVSRRREWEDDCVVILQENRLLDCVIGRQPSILEDKKDIPDVDEFGRDIRSLESLARAKRKSERLRRREECRYQENDEIYDYGSDNEMMHYEEGRLALADAVQVVLDELNEEYSSLAALLGLFDSWKSRSEDDYKQCYASFALRHFASILAEAEVYKTMDLACLIKEQSGHPQSIQEFSWFRTIRDSSLIKDTKEGGPEEIYSHLARIFLWNTLKINIRGTKNDTVTETVLVLDILSHKQCTAVGKFYESISRYFEKDADKLVNYFCAYVDSYIQDFAVPIIVRTSKLADALDGDSDLKEAIKYSTLNQLQIFGRILYNTVTIFYPVLSYSESLAKYCLMDIIAHRILPIVESSLLVYPDQTKSEFQSIFQTVKNAGLIDSSALMMASAPLRAASVRYGIA
jgi:hypothetical protein